jgi:hypothetical protein
MLLRHLSASRVAGRGSRVKVARPVESAPQLEPAPQRRGRCRPADALSLAQTANHLTFLASRRGEVGPGSAEGEPSPAGTGADEWHDTLILLVGAQGDGPQRPKDQDFCGFWGRDRERGLRRRGGRPPDCRRPRRAGLEPGVDRVDLGLPVLERVDPVQQGLIGIIPWAVHP